jgi:hypothetical protein
VLARPCTPSTLEACRLGIPGHHCMEEVRVSSPPKLHPLFPWSVSNPHFTLCWALSGRRAQILGALASWGALRLLFMVFARG